MVLKLSSLVQTGVSVAPKMDARWSYTKRLKTKSIKVQSNLSSNLLVFPFLNFFAKKRKKIDHIRRRTCTCIIIHGLVALGTGLNLDAIALYRNGVARVPVYGV